MNSSTSSSRRLVTAYAAGLAAAFGAFAGASEWLVRAQVAPADTITQHVSLFRETQSPFAVFGDSHAARGFDAAAPVVNLAYPSENFIRMDWKIDRYLNKTTPQVVVLQADPHLFAPYRLEEGLGDYPADFEQSPPAFAAFSDRYRPQLIALWRSFIARGGRIASSIEVTPQGALLSPGDLEAWSAPKAAQFTADRVTLHRPARGPAFDAAAAQYRAMAEKLSQAGARLCLVAFPVSPIYRAELAARPAAERDDWARADAFYQSVAADVGGRYLDHRALYDDAGLYRDPDHLNADGAKVYGPVLQDACFGDDEAPRIAAAD